jgi:uncharacterized protein YkwD
MLIYGGPGPGAGRLVSDSMSRFEVSNSPGRSFFDDEPAPEHAYASAEAHAAPDVYAAPDTYAVADTYAAPDTYGSRGFQGPDEFRDSYDTGYRGTAYREPVGHDDGYDPFVDDDELPPRSRGARVARTGALVLLVLLLFGGATYAGTRLFATSGDRAPSASPTVSAPAEAGDTTTLPDIAAEPTEGVPSPPAQSPEAAATTAAPNRTPAQATRPPVTAVPAAPAKGEREEVLRLVNVERAKAGCAALTEDGKLRQAADAHSADQATAGKISHVGTDGAELGTRVDRFGYRWRGIGENVAAGYANPAAVMQGWMNSDGHRANILNCGFKNIGVGLATKGRTIYWTQVFGTPA